MANLRYLLFLSALVGLCCALPCSSRADTTFTISNTVADAFLATGSPNNPIGTDLTGRNFGGAGTLAISPQSSTKGAMTSVIKFNLGDAVTQFNSTYGAARWQVTAITLSLASNFGDQGEQPLLALFNTINAGTFAIDWLSTDDWVEGSAGGMGGPGFPSTSAVSYNSIPNLYSGAHDSLGTYTYTPPGDNLYLNYPLPLTANLVADATAGGDVSLYFYPADGQVSYLFNSRSFASNHPRLTLTATTLLKLLSLTFTNGSAHMIGIGSTNASYQIQASSDLSSTNWDTIGTVMADDAGVVEFEDGTALNTWQRFYRLAK